MNSLVNFFSRQLMEHFMVFNWTIRKLVHFSSFLDITSSPMYEEYMSEYFISARYQLNVIISDDTQ